jgi:sec-independent protein translocase protein TatB
MFDINKFEFVVLALIALVVLGPEQLPKYAADAGRFIRQVRAMATDARREVQESLGPEFKDIDLESLNPRTMVRKHIFDPDEYDLGLDDDDDPAPAKRRSASMFDKEPAAGGSRPARSTGATRLDKSADADGVTPGGGAARDEVPSTPYDPDAT